ncbi:membrane protein [Candidatus Megaera polyxenophila]|nr:membrane protein [Candidatus Megaera polyxenophila]
MKKHIYQHTFKKSPWEDSEPKENIFTKKRRDQFNFDNFQFNFNPKSVIWILGGIILLWLANGFYKVEEGEEAAIIRFGKFNRTAMPGLNYKLPSPFETLEIEKVAQSRRIEIGYRSSGKLRNNIGADLNKDRDIAAESIMLTGDENIIELNVDVMWHISNLSDYLFNVTDPEEAVKAVSESAIREVIGNMPIASVLSNQKQEITEKIEGLIKQILEQYKIGVAIEQVKLLKAEPPKEAIQAYRDVQTAKADKEKEINEAQSYRNNILPKARGEAAKILEESEGYKVEVIAKAEGDASRFNAIYEQYLLNKEVTRGRLYLDALKEILYQSDKVIMGTEGVLPHMAVKPKASTNSQ